MNEHFAPNDITAHPRVSPLTIRIMLACYYSPDPAKDVGTETWDSSSGQNSREWLFAEELIDNRAKATCRGNAWICYILSTPLPIQKWVLPKREEI